MFRVPVFLTVSLLAAAGGAQKGEESAEKSALRTGHREEATVVLRHVDFLALDRKGRPVTDLRTEEVRLWDGGRRHEIVELVRSHERPRTERLGGARKRGTGAPGAARPVPRASAEDERSGFAKPRWIVLLFDANNLSYPGRIRSARALADLVERELRPEDRVALVVDEAELRVVVPFSSSRPALLWHLRHPEGLTARRRDLDDRLEDLRDAANGCRGAGHFAEMAACAERAVGGFLLESDRETERSLDHLEALFRSLAAIPDRKIVFLVSEGFLVNPGDVAAAAVEHAIGQNGFDLAHVRSRLFRDHGHRLDRVYALATESRTGVYPVNTLRRMSADVFAPERRMDGGPESLPRTRTDPFEATWSQISDVHRDLARATGGVPVLARDPRGRCTEQLRSSGGVYTVSYHPEDVSARRRRLRIEVDRRGVALHYRDHRRGASRHVTPLAGELAVETSPTGLRRGNVRARLKVAAGELAVVNDSGGPTSRVALFIELADGRERPVKNLYEVLSFPRGADDEASARMIERPFALEVPPGDYVVSVYVRDVHGPGRGAFVRRFSHRSPVTR